MSVIQASSRPGPSPSTLVSLTLSGGWMSILEVIDHLVDGSMYFTNTIKHVSE